MKGRERVQCLLCGGIHVEAVADLFAETHACLCECCTPVWLARAREQLVERRERAVAEFAARRASEAPAGPFRFLRGMRRISFASEEEMAEPGASTASGGGR